ncbi:MAG TPA: hypothetical protein EYP57_05500 [Thermodesulfobacteriaceae bacterium]|nr:hypothetical protein [Thermodesulfobacteriaceae bacterium]
MNKLIVNISALVICTLMIFVSTAAADDVMDTINEAIAQYKNGEYSAAVESLEYASNLILQKKGLQLKKLLPEPLPGWAAEEASSQAAGKIMFGGGVTAERTYNRGDKSIIIKLATDSPLLQSIMMMFTNPMFAVSDGGRLERIRGQKAIINYKSATETGTINIVVANRFLVTLEGDHVTKADLMAYANKIDYRALTDLP